MLVRPGSPVRALALHPVPALIPDIDAPVPTNFQALVPTSPRAPLFQVPSVFSSSCFPTSF